MSTSDQIFSADVSLPSKRKLTLTWISTLSVWVVLGLIYAGPIYIEVRSEGMNHAAWRIFSWGILTWCAWAPLTPLIFWLARKYPIIGSYWKRNLLVQVPAFLLVSVAHTAAATAVTLYIKPFDNMGSSPMEFWPRFIARVPSAFGSDLLIYSAVLGVCYAIDYYQKYREREFVASQLEAQLAQAQLDSLRMQLHPHFLFNTLNGIVGLVRDHKNEAAIGMLVGLSDLLRHALEHSDEQEIELRDELDFINLYLKIQQMRFSDRLQVKIEVEPEVMKALVPNLILQPLIENALRHGIGRSTASGQIDINAAAEDDFLRITISDNGVGLPSDWQLKSSSGIGLANTLARLQQLYDCNQRFDIRSRKSGGVEVVVLIPLHWRESFRS